MVSIDFHFRGNQRLGCWISALGLLKLEISFPAQTKQIVVCSQSKFAQELVFIESKRQVCSFRMKVGEKIVLKENLSKSPTVRAGGR